MNNFLPISSGKTTIYNPNGSGRDSYIYHNSGGFTISKPAPKYSDIGTFSSPKK